MRSKHKSYWQSVKQTQNYFFDIFSGTHFFISTGVNIAMPPIITFSYIWIAFWIP